MINIRFQYATGSSLSISIEHLANGLYYDFSAGAFVARSGQTVPMTPLPEDSGPFLGRYALTLQLTPSPPFLDGDYCVTIHDSAAAPGSAVVVAELSLSMFNGQDATVFPPRYWQVAMTGSTHKPA